MSFLLFLLDDRRIRIRISDPAQEQDQKHMYPADQEYWLQQSSLAMMV